MLHSQLRWVSSLIPVVVLSAPGLAAQGLATVIGSVRTYGEGVVIEGARVELVGTKHTAMTSPKGEFSLRNLTPGKYVIQATAIGFAKLSAEIEIRASEILEVAFEAQAEAIRLPELSVSEAPRLPPEFERRSMEGGGRYMSRTEIERRPSASTVADLLRSFPGVRLSCRRYPCYAEFTRTLRSCPPAFFLDGIQTEPAAVMMQPAREVDGIEVYSGLAETPPELKGRNNCGAFVVWTRIPPDARKRKP